MPDHYAVLGVQRDATEADIKKAYRKEALRWHPDKNPDKKELAEKRFKDISQAFKVLSDPDERAHFDRYGEERQAGGGPPRRRHPGGGHPGMYAEELTPEDIFNMFFGMPPRGGQRHHHHQGGMPRRAHPQADVNVNLLQLAPFLLLFCFSILSSLPGLSGDSSPYSLSRGDSYYLERATELGGVRYWVGETFELYHADASSLRKVEDRVESDNLQRVRRQCNAERASKQKMIDAANSVQGSERSRMFEAADAMRMRWCEEKDRLDAARAG